MFALCALIGKIQNKSKYCTTCTGSSNSRLFFPPFFQRNSKDSHTRWIATKKKISHSSLRLLDCAVASPLATLNTLVIDIALIGFKRTIRTKRFSFVSYQLEVLFVFIIRSRQRFGQTKYSKFAVRGFLRQPINENIFVSLTHPTTATANQRFVSSTTKSTI